MVMVIGLSVVGVFMYLVSIGVAHEVIPRLYDVLPDAVFPFGGFPPDKDDDELWFASVLWPLCLAAVLIVNPVKFVVLGGAGLGIWIVNLPRKLIEFRRNRVKLPKAKVVNG